MIVEILSRIPLKTAVATDVLSRRWCGLWRQINHTNIDFNTNIVDNMKYVCTKVLPQMPNLSVRRFSLYLDRTFIEWALGKPEPWFHQICDRNVQEIHLQYAIANPWLGNEIPSSVFKTPTLVVLELGPKLYAMIYGSINLPNLKKLSLHEVYCSSICGLLQKFISSCPLLEELFVEVTTRSADVPRETWEVVEISSKNLKKLDFYANMKELVIDAPNLQYLTYRYEKLVGFHYYFSLFTSVESIDNNCALVFLGRLCNLRSLKLFHMPKFGAFGPSTMFPTANLLDVLKFCPALEILTLGLSGAYQYDFVSPSSEHACRLTNLKSIEIEAWHGLQLDKNLLNMVGYLLTNAPVLERFRFKKTELQGYASKGMEPFKFWSDIRALPRSSLFCQFDFSVKYIKSFEKPFGFMKSELCDNLLFNMSV